jgi:hypothetical protein
MFLGERRQPHMKCRRCDLIGSCPDASVRREQQKSPIRGKNGPAHRRSVSRERPVARSRAVTERGGSRCPAKIDKNEKIHKDHVPRGILCMVLATVEEGTAQRPAIEQGGIAPEDFPTPSASSSAHAAA